MTERARFDRFEEWLADELGRYVETASDPRPASQIAQVAMRPRGLIVRGRNWRARRRVLVIGLAAALLVPVAYLAAVGTVPPPDRPTSVRPSPAFVAEPSSALQPTPAGSPGEGESFVPVFVRRDDDPQPGVSILAVQPDGSEVLVRNLPDTSAPAGGKFATWGAVSDSGWLALSVDKSGGPWPLILVDLSEAGSAPWVIDEANVGGISPRWGPTGLVAAAGPDDEGARGVVIADPLARSTRQLSMQGHGLVGGGPSIVWAGDASGIVGASDTGYAIIPIDGGTPRADVGSVFDPHGVYGPAMATLRICSPDVTCVGRADGRVERVATDSSARTIWQQTGNDRALAASFGRDERYWVTTDHDAGRQVAVVQARDGRQETAATFNRDAAWQYVGAPVEAPDGSALVLFVDLNATPAAVVAPLRGDRPTFHAGQFAGFARSAAFAASGNGESVTPGQTLPAVGETYRLPSINELIGAELSMNPGRRVLGSASRDGEVGATEVQTFDVPRDEPGAGEAYLDCAGPASVTLTSGANSVTSQCLRAGAYVLHADEGQALKVTASGETSWRVVIYSSPG
jgi:hypothetical protein